MKEKALSSLKSLLKEDDFRENKSQIQDLFREYDKDFNQRRKELLQKFTADGDNPNDFLMPLVDTDKAIAELKEVYRKRLKTLEESQKKEEKENLEVKRTLLEEFQKLIESEDKINVAYDRYNAIKERWNSLGRIPSHTVRELQDEFRNLNEKFFYNIKIYRELRQNDLKRNLELKKDLIDRMEKLIGEENMQEVETLHKAFQTEWDHIGPTFKEEWEEIQDKFYSASHQIQTRIRDHYKQIKEGYKENLLRKQALITKVQNLIERELNSVSAWNKAQEEIKEIQAEWKTIGFATKSQNDKIWKEFREVIDLFFKKKKEYFNDLKGEQSKISARKKQLIDKAKELTELPDDLDRFHWGSRIKELKALQEEWKNAGAALRSEEQKLWKKFRGHFDAFFEAKKQFEAGAKDREAANAKTKEKLIASLESFQKGKDPDNDKALILSIEKEWSAVGFVPKSQKEKLESSFKKALDKAWKELGMDRAEQTKVRFTARIDTLKEKGGGSGELKSERKKVKDQLSKKRADLLQLENNLSFFSGSAESNPLLKNALNSVEEVKQAIEQLQAKEKMLNISVREAEKSAHSDDKEKEGERAE